MKECQKCGLTIYNDTDNYCINCKKIFENHFTPSPPTEWLIPCNTKHYDIIKAIKDHDIVYWRARALVNKNDIVYLYLRGEFTCLIKTLVCDTNKKEEDLPYDDSQYYINWGKKSKRDYFFLTNFVLIYDERISLDNFNKKGLKGNIRSPIILDNFPKLLEYIHEIENKPKSI